MSIESTLNVSKVSTLWFQICFWRIKCQHLVEIMLHCHSAQQYLSKNSNNMLILK